LTVLLASLAVLLAFGVAERLARDAAWRAVPVRVHVNGTRGKSTVTRLIWSALREAGIPALAKTTGTAPRVLLPDGRERPLPRRAPASIREQLELLRLARREGARALVAECMAVDPALQWVSEHEMIRASVGVITNVRTDHTEMMGPNLEDIANSLANTIPRGGVIVSGESRFAALLAHRADLAGARLVAVPAPGVDDVGRWLGDDERLALTVTRQLGIADDVAARGFARAPRDPGAARGGTLAAVQGEVRWLDATAANDPESLAALVAEMTGEGPGDCPNLVVYNHRADRSPRLSCFADRSAVIGNARPLVLTGARPPWTVWRRLRARRQGAPPIFVPRRRLARWLRAHAGPGAALVFCGNTRGLDVAATIDEVGRG